MFRKRTPWKRISIEEYNGAMFGYLCAGLRDVVADLERITWGEKPRFEAKIALRKIDELNERANDI